MSDHVYALEFALLHCLALVLRSLWKVTSSRGRKITCEQYSHVLRSRVYGVLHHSNCWFIPPPTTGSAPRLPPPSHLSKLLSHNVISPFVITSDTVITRLNFAQGPAILCTTGCKIEFIALIQPQSIPYFFLFLFISYFSVFSRFFSPLFLRHKSYDVGVLRSGMAPVR